MSIKLLTPPEVAKRTGWSRQKVRDLIAANRLPAINTSTKDRPRWFIRECDLEEFLTPTEKREKPSTPAKPAKRSRLDANVPQVL